MMIVMFLISFLLCGYCSAQTTTSYKLVQKDKDNFLNAHNAVRKAYGVPPLVWDAQLEADSAAYAALCKINPLTHSGAAGVGENLATYMAYPKPSTWLYKTADYHIVNQWYTEEANWNCVNNVCDTSGGKQCGHLTQIVWADTTAVGCGIAYCTMVSSGKTWNVQNAVCRYKSPGNYVGKHPLEPTKSTSTKCPTFPTTLPPLTPPPPAAPVAPTAPKAPPTAPKASPVTPTTVPVAPKATPVTPPKAATPIAPKSGPWWSGCKADDWTTGKQQINPCAWEPWLSGGKTYCCPNPNDQYDYSWPVLGLGTPDCPDGIAKAFARAEESADTMSGLPMPAWIGIGVGIAVVIIIIIVVVIVVKKKQNDERV